MIGFLFAHTSPQQYTKIARIHASTASVYTLAISHDGELLASGGADGMTIWRISSGKEISSSGTNQDTCGAVSCAIWMKTRFTTTETLCYGTGLGYLVFLRPNPVDRKFQEVCARRLGAGFEITCVAWDASWLEDGLRVAVGMRDNVVQVLLLNANSQLQSIFAGRLDDTVPRSVAFSGHENLYIFGLFDGKVMNISDGNILNEHHCGSIIGYTAISLKKHLVVVDNAANGFTLYRLDSPSPIRTYITEPPTVLVPKQVAFGEDVKIVVGGSDNGNVYIFNRRSGELLEALCHARSGLVQSIAVRDIDGHCKIASASATPGRRCVTINIWQHQYAPPKLNNKPNLCTRWTLKSSLWVMVRILTLVALLVALIGLGIARLDPVPQIAHWCAKFQEERVSALRSSPEPVKGRYPLTGDESGGMTLQDMAERFMALALQADHSTFAVHDQREEQVSTNDRIIYL
ncbi:WD40-repeat-containing domain protein [Boletus reticuloceps]|uniref:WD40-repeat-containing domain protein n=1 Tax=Boletus reticuloceps TaxID=495285 RepID=A0A8I3A258_9AGAM|nr:WD40-repeat-containing domain protein [Boletus reticuloceps]